MPARRKADAEKRSKRIQVAFRPEELADLAAFAKTQKGRPDLSGAARALTLLSLTGPKMARLYRSLFEALLALETAGRQQRRGQRPGDDAAFVVADLAMQRARASFAGFEGPLKDALVESVWAWDEPNLGHREDRLLASEEALGEDLPKILSGDAVEDATG